MCRGSVYLPQSPASPPYLLFPSSSRYLLSTHVWILVSLCLFLFSLRLCPRFSPPVFSLLPLLSSPLTLTLTPLFPLRFSPLSASGCLSFLSLFSFPATLPSPFFFLFAVFCHFLSVLHFSVFSALFYFLICVAFVVFVFVRFFSSRSSCPFSFLFLPVFSYFCFPLFYEVFPFLCLRASLILSSCSCPLSLFFFNSFSLPFSWSKVPRSERKTKLLFRSISPLFFFLSVSLSPLLPLNSVRRSSVRQQAGTPSLSLNAQHSMFKR